MKTSLALTLVTACAVAGGGTGAALRAFHSDTPSHSQQPPTIASTTTPRPTVTHTAQPPKATPTTTPAVTPPPTRPQPCRSTGVRLTLTYAGAAAGSSGENLIVTNVGRDNCLLMGYALVHLLSSGAVLSATDTGGQVDGPVNPEPVILAPGKQAAATVLVADADNYPAKQCGVVTTNGLQVILPGDSGMVVLPMKARGCTNPKDNVLRVMPFSTQFTTVTP